MDKKEQRKNSLFHLKKVVGLCRFLFSFSDFYISLFLVCDKVFGTLFKLILQIYML